MFHTLIVLITYVGLQHQPVSDLRTVAEEQSSLISSETTGLLKEPRKALSLSDVKSMSHYHFPNRPSVQQKGTKRIS